MVRFRKALFASCLAMMTTMSVARAEPVGQASDAWQRMAEADLSAAYQLILENHPGAVAELGDEHFRVRLERGYQTAKQRLDEVASYQGYMAVLAGFATSFEDEHIWTNPKLRGIAYRWAGLVTARRGAQWFVAHHERQASEPDLVGARLVSCDGKDAESFAKKSLAFRVSAPIEAQRVAHGGFMLVDDGNPFLSRPHECVFERDAARTKLTLNWRSVPTSQLASGLQKSIESQAAGFGIQADRDLVWVAIERLSSEAQPVLDEFARRRAELLALRTIVIDVRGNGGGNSLYGRELAKLIYGNAYVAAKLRTSSACGAVWRASKGNLAHLRQSASNAPNPDMANHLNDVAARMEAAMAAKQPFEAPLPACAKARAEKQRGTMPKPEFTGRVVLLTDHACFSSCLLLTKDFSSLGALHVGTETNAATRYMEVREIVLPSGLSTFSTLQKVLIGGETDVGPFTSQKIAPRGTGDTEALKRWIVELTRPT